MRYFIPVHTPIWRRTLQDLVWIPFVSKKAVTYTEEDLIHEPSILSDGVWRFRLPQSALPYIEVCVEKHDAEQVYE